MKVLFLFIDGVGLSEAAVDNPVNREVAPTLCRLIEKDSKPIDACLGVEGPPQSATGQSTIFTGVNCSEVMGRHCEGFPGPSLRKIIETDNIFLELARRGYKVRFANAYLLDSRDELASRRFKSVTSVMGLTVPESLSFVGELERGEALYQDITGETALDRYPELATVSPETAAGRLFSIARRNDFTLFEFYQTDMAGHSGDYERACTVLRMYDHFLAALLRYVKAAGITLVITSDHGNLEKMSERGHSFSRVPFIAVGPSAGYLLESIESLIDITPAILSAFDRS